ncbi:MAG: hypothetical protein IKO56_00945 [Alphaproteobacteria bacterium]|nr:hypothetical protein [Alphaproteobacteria bacterium]
MTEEQHKRANDINNQMSEIKNALQIVDFGDTVSVSFHDTRNETSYNIELDNVATEAFATELRKFIKEYLQTRLAELTKEYAEL